VNEEFKKIPKVDELLLDQKFQEVSKDTGFGLIKKSIHSVLDSIRNAIKKMKLVQKKKKLFS